MTIFQFAISIVALAMLVASILAAIMAVREKAEGRRRLEKRLADVAADDEAMAPPQKGATACMPGSTRRVRANSGPNLQKPRK